MMHGQRNIKLNEYLFMYLTCTLFITFGT